MLVNARLSYISVNGLHYSSGDETTVVRIGGTTVQMAM
jgi:hypothetical protein